MSDDTPWKKIYQAGFEIKITEPSRLARTLIGMIPEGSKILDGGCGAGRNSIFFAKNGFIVDAVDTEDFHFADNLSEELKAKIHFSQKSIVDFAILENAYNGILLARLVQYIDRKDMAGLFEKLSKGLAKDGILALIYKKSLLGDGRINSLHVLNNTDYDIEYIIELLKNNGLEVIKTAEEIMADKNIEGSLPGYVYQLIAKRNK